MWPVETVLEVLRRPYLREAWSSDHLPPADQGFRPGDLLRSKGEVELRPCRGQVVNPPIKLPEGTPATMDSPYVTGDDLEHMTVLIGNLRYLTRAEDWELSPARMV